MNPEREKFLKIIEELARKYDVETTVTTENFVIVPVGSKRQGDPSPKSKSPLSKQSDSSSSSKKSAASVETIGYVKGQYPGITNRRTASNPFPSRRKVK